MILLGIFEYTILRTYPFYIVLWSLIRFKREFIRLAARDLYIREIAGRKVKGSFRQVLTFSGIVEGCAEEEEEEERDVVGRLSKGGEDRETAKVVSRR